MDKKHIEVRNAIVNSFLRIMPLLKQKKIGKVRKCKICGFVSAGELCKACFLLNELKKK
jgi:hypothetical protein